MYRTICHFNYYKSLFLDFVLKGLNPLHSANSGLTRKSDDYDSHRKFQEVTEKKLLLSVLKQSNEGV